MPGLFQVDRPYIQTGREKFRWSGYDRMVRGLITLPGRGSVGTPMKIIALKSYKTGYVGILEEKDQYVYFNLSKRGRYKKIRNFPKKNYCSLEHFIDTLTKFTPRRFFLKDPLTVDAMTLEAFHEGLKDLRLNRYTASRRDA